MRVDRDRSTRARELAIASTFLSARAEPSRASAELADGDDCPAPEFVSQLMDVTQELADVIASANADVE